MRRSSTRRRRSDPGIAQSEVLGVILLLSLTMTGIAIVMTTGMPSLRAAQEEARVASAVNAMSLLDERVSSASLSGSEQKRLSFNLGEGSLEIRSDTGWMCVNDTAPCNRTTPDNLELYNSSHLGSLTYEFEDRLVAFQNGGVWMMQEAKPNSSFSQSAPEFHYRGETLTVSVINITNEISTTTGSVQNFLISHGQTEKVHPVPGDWRRSNPVSGEIYVTVHSKYYVGWARYFNQSVRSTVVDVDHGAETATVRLEPKPPAPFRHALLSTGKKIELRGDVLLDSYNSELGEYPGECAISGASIVAETSIELQKQSGEGPLVCGDVGAKTEVTAQDPYEIEGGIEVEGTGATSVDLPSGFCNVSGDIRAPSPASPGGCSGRWSDTSPRVTVDPPIEIGPKIWDVLDETDSAPSPPTDTNGDDIINVSPGDYHADGFDFTNWDGKEVRFKTSGGRVRIAANNGTSKINPVDTIFNVTGSEPVQFYRGFINDNNAVRFRNLTVTTSENRTDLVQVFVPPEELGAGTGPKLEIDEQSLYRGVVYAPGNDRIFVDDQSEIFGAIVAEHSRIRGGSQLHYDASLRGLRLDIEKNVPKVNHLYLTDNRIDIR